MSDTFSPLAFDPSRWEPILAESARHHHVPGIVAGVLRVDPLTGVERRFAASNGVSNTRTGVKSTPDTLCQVGSITKVVTATMIMQLREEGRLDLDTRVIELLPELELQSEHTSEITIEHLLTHTSGIDGDVFTDTGRGDDCIAKYVSELKNNTSLFSPGNGWSYCNSGFVLAGRIIEVLDERSWDESLQVRICRRLDLTQFLTLPEEVMGHLHQYGHVRQPAQRDWHPAPVATIARSMGPAGIITSSVDNLLDFGGAFLRGGRGVAGEALLTPESVRLMTEPRVTLDPAASATAPQWGIGWMLDDWNGHRVMWHGGTTIGNNAWFHVLPEDGLVFAVFCNGGVAPMAAPEIFAAFAEVFAGTLPSAALRPTGPASGTSFDDRLLGRYADASTSIVVSRGLEDELSAELVREFEPSGSNPETVKLLPTDGEQRFVIRTDDLSPWTQVAFSEVDGAACVYVGIRCLRKQDEQENAPFVQDSPRRNAI